MKPSRSPRFHASTPPSHTAFTSAAGSPTRDGDDAHAVISNSSVVQDILVLVRMTCALEAALKLRPYVVNFMKGVSYRRAVDSVLQPLFASSKPSKSRPAFSPASVSRRCGCPFSTLYRATVPFDRRYSASCFISPCHMYSSRSPTYMKTHMFEIA